MCVFKIFKKWGFRLEVVQEFSAQKFTLTILLHVILVSGIFSTNFYAIDLRNTIGLNGDYESNINDNFNQNELIYVTPWWHTYMNYQMKALKKSKVKNSFQVGSKITYNQYIEDRSPILNTPLYRSYIQWTLRNKNFKSKLGYHLAETYSPDWTNVKRQQRVYLKTDQEVSQLEFSQELSFDLENYGDPKQDGYTYYFESDISHKMNTKPFQWIPQLGYSIENRRSNAGLYTYIRQGIPIKLTAQHKDFQFKIWSEYSLKQYALRVLDKTTNQPTQRQNVYWYYGGALDFDLGDYQISTGYQLKEVESNQIGYSYPDHNVFLNLSYKFPKFTF